TLAEGLDPGALLEVLVDDAPLGCGHRVELDLPAGLQSPLGSPLGLTLDRLAATIPVAGGVDEHSLAVLATAERRPIAEELHGVDRRAAPADEQSDVLPVDSADDLLLLVDHLDAGI